MRTGGAASVDVMFDASWWHKFYEIAFDETYVRATPRYRAELEGKMRRALYERFRTVGLGAKTAEPVPVISTQMVPLCYLVVEVFGCRTFFTAGCLGAKQTRRDVRHRQRRAEGQRRSGKVVRGGRFAAK